MGHKLLSGRMTFKKLTNELYKIVFLLDILMAEHVGSIPIMQFIPLDIQIREVQVINNKSLVIHSRMLITGGLLKDQIKMI